MVEKIFIITQARMGSTRLPGKIFKKIGDETLLSIHCHRLSKVKNADKIIVATTKSKLDTQVFEWATQNGFLSYAGSENDVLDRFYQAAKPYAPKWIVRVTSDCPLLDPILVEEVIELAKDSKVDYCSNIIVENFPDGQDVEVFTFESLEKAWKEARLPSEREHVTPYIRKNVNNKGLSLFTAKNFDCDGDYSEIRMTVDEEIDFQIISKLITDLGKDKTWKEYVDYMFKHRLVDYNKDIIRNEGYIKSINKDK